MFVCLRLNVGIEKEKNQEIFVFVVGGGVGGEFKEHQVEFAYEWAHAFFFLKYIFYISFVFFFQKKILFINPDSCSYSSCYVIVK